MEAGAGTQGAASSGRDGTRARRIFRKNGESAGKIPRLPFFVVVNFFEMVYNAISYVNNSRLIRKGKPSPAESGRIMRGN